MGTSEGEGEAVRVTHCFFDYDSTITRPVFLQDVGQWAISDNPDVCARLTAEQTVEQFGGAGRLGQLKVFFESLTAKHGIECHVVSHGRERAINAQLEAVGLRVFFSAVVASDMPALKRLRHNKGAYIAQVLAQAGRPPAAAIFADDSERNIAAAAGVCTVYHVTKRHLTLADLRALHAMCTGKSPPEVAREVH